jgi:hypothetical protein
MLTYKLLLKLFFWAIIKAINIELIFIRVFYYDIMVFRWFVVVWDDTIQDLMIIVKSKLNDSIRKDEKVRLMEVSYVIIYSLVTNYTIAYEEKFIFNIIYFFWNDKYAIIYKIFIIPEYSKN